MSLTPAREQAAPTEMLNAWLRRHNGYLFNVTPFQIGDNGNDNQENHRSLVRLLNDKNIVCGLSSLNRSFIDKHTIYSTPSPRGRTQQAR